MTDQTTDPYALPEGIECAELEEYMTASDGDPEVVIAALCAKVGEMDQKYGELAEATRVILKRAEQAEAKLAAQVEYAQSQYEQSNINEMVSLSLKTELDDLQAKLTAANETIGLMEVDSEQAQEVLAAVEGERERLYSAQLSAMREENVGNEGDADAIRRDAIRQFFGIRIGTRWPKDYAAYRAQKDDK